MTTRSTFCAVVILAVRRETGTQFVGGSVERDHDLEVLGLFSAGGGLRGGDAGGAKQGLIADQRDVALEDLAGKRVDGDVGGLADLDVDDVGFVHLHFGSDDAHVGKGHQRGAFGVLNAVDDGFAFADRQVGHDAVKWSDRNGLAQMHPGWRGECDLLVTGVRVRRQSAPWPG